MHELLRGDGDGFERDQLLSIHLRRVENPGGLVSRLPRKLLTLVTEGFDCFASRPDQSRTQDYLEI